MLPSTNGRFVVMFSSEIRSPFLISFSAMTDLHAFLNLDSLLVNCAFSYFPNATSIVLIFHTIASSSSGSIAKG